MDLINNPEEQKKPATINLLGHTLNAPISSLEELKKEYAVYVVDTSNEDGYTRVKVMDFCLKTLTYWITYGLAYRELKEASAHAEIIISLTKR